MSRADSAARIVEAAIALGASQGVGALSLQQVGAAGGVSKALVLYHFREKDRLLAAVAEALAARDVAALEAAAAAADALDAWRAVAGDATRRAERALLAALLQEQALRPLAGMLTAKRVGAATALAVAVFRVAGLQARIGGPLLGRVAVHQLDGLAVASAGRAAEHLDAELDALALALLGLGR